jgi:hypothetical protein
VFPPLNLAAGELLPRRSLFRTTPYSKWDEARNTSSKLGVSMPDASSKSDEETNNTFGQMLSTLLETAKPYLAAAAIVTILISIWIGLCAT